MAARYGADTAVPEWRGRFVCSSYGSREAEMVTETERRDCASEALTLSGVPQFVQPGYNNGSATGGLDPAITGVPLLAMIGALQRPGCCQHRARIRHLPRQVAGRPARALPVACQRGAAVGAPPISEPKVRRLAAGARSRLCRRRHKVRQRGYKTDSLRLG